jgi:hypothetical protein
MQVQGNVEWSGGKTFNGKVLYSVKVGGTFYRCGTVNPSVERDDYVVFEFEEERGQNVIDMKTFKKKENTEPQVQSKEVKSYAKAGNSSSPKRSNTYEPNDDRQKMISWQAAINSATVIVNGAIEQGLIKISGRNQQVKYDAYRAAIIEEAKSLFKLTQEVPSNYENLIADKAVEDDVPGTDAVDFSGLENEEDFTDD